MTPASTLLFGDPMAESSNKKRDTLGEFLTQYDEYLDGRRAYSDLPIFPSAIPWDPNSGSKNDTVPEQIQDHQPLHPAFLKERRLPRWTFKPVIFFVFISPTVLQLPSNMSATAWSCVGYALEDSSGITALQGPHLPRILDARHALRLGREACDHLRHVSRHS